MQNKNILKEHDISEKKVSPKLIPDWKLSTSYKYMCVCVHTLSNLNTYISEKLTSQMTVLCKTTQILEKRQFKYVYKIYICIIFSWNAWISAEMTFYLKLILEMQKYLLSIYKTLLAGSSTIWKWMTLTIIYCF